MKQLKHENEKQAELIKWLQQQLENKENTLRLALADNHELHIQLGMTPSDNQNDQHSDDNTFDGESKADTKETTSEPVKRHWWQLW